MPFILGAEWVCLFMSSVSLIELFVLMPVWIMDSISCTALPKHHLDHCSLLLSLVSSKVPEPRPFRFMKMWVQHPRFMALIEKVW